jgi:hypothetical protein
MNNRDDSRFRDHLFTKVNVNPIQAKLTAQLLCFSEQTVTEEI